MLWISRVKTTNLLMAVLM